MEITGQVIEVMPVDSFTKGDKSYDSQNIIIQVQDGQYANKVALHVFGSDRIQKCHVQVGEVITASFDLRSRDFTDKNGGRRWSTSVDVWKISRGTNQQGYAPQAGYQQAPPQGYVPMQQQYAPQQPQYASQPQAPFQPQQPAYGQPQMPFPPVGPNDGIPY